MSVIPKSMWGPLPADWREQLNALWPDGERLLVAWEIAGDVDTLADLLAGRAVDPARLKPDALERARRRRLVRLDVRAIDLILEDVT